MKYHLMIKSGRCANGFELGKGSVVHAVPDWHDGVEWRAAEYGVGPALCGAQPGRRSAGWNPPWQAVTEPTCPRCAKKLATLTVKA